MLFASASVAKRVERAEATLIAEFARNVQRQGFELLYSRAILIKSLNPNH
jgi:hypothetical protein